MAMEVRSCPILVGSIHPSCCNFGENPVSIGGAPASPSSSAASFSQQHLPSSSSCSIPHHPSTLRPAALNSPLPIVPGRHRSERVSSTLLVTVSILKIRMFVLVILREDDGWMMLDDVAELCRSSALSIGFRASDPIMRRRESVGPRCDDSSAASRHQHHAAAVIPSAYSALAARSVQSWPAASGDMHWHR